MKNFENFKIKAHLGKKTLPKCYILCTGHGKLVLFVNDLHHLELHNHNLEHNLTLRWDAFPQYSKTIPSGRQQCAQELRLGAVAMVHMGCCWQNMWTRWHLRQFPLQEFLVVASICSLAEVGLIKQCLKPLSPVAEYVKLNPSFFRCTSIKSEPNWLRWEQWHIPFYVTFFYKINTTIHQEVMKIINNLPSFVSSWTSCSLTCSSFSSVSSFSSASHSTTK